MSGTALHIRRTRWPKLAAVMSKEKYRDKEKDKVKDSPRNCGGVKRPTNSEQGAVDNEVQSGGGGVGQ